LPYIALIFYISRFIAAQKRTKQLFRSKRLSLLTIFALVVTSLSGLASAASANVSPFSTFTVNGTAVTDGSVVVISAETKSADVVVSGAVAYDITAFVGAINAVAEAVPNEDFSFYSLTDTFSNLPFGDSELVVRTGNALEPESIYSATVTLRVTSLLSSLKINNVETADRTTVYLEPKTKSVEVLPVAVDENATITVEGATGLEIGANELTVTVTNSDNVTGVYTINLDVPANENTGATFTVNGTTIANEGRFTVPFGTTEVAVEVTLADVDATFFITGELDLQTGENPVTVTVTAEDTVTIQEYSFIVEVLRSTNTAVNSIVINGITAVEGEGIDIDSRNTEVSVEVDTVDTDATVTVVGDTELVVGENIVAVTVTAADEVTTQTYNVTVNLVVSFDTSLSIFNVAGIDVQDADFVVVPALTTDVDVVVEVTDQDATFEIVGGTDLVPGDNDLIVTVTAFDGETIQEYFVTITVLPNTDTTFASLSVNGEEVEDGGTVEVPPFTDEVSVDVILNDELASFVIDGNEGLVVGENTITITVTAADELTFADYFVTVIVALSNDASMADLSVAWVGPEGDASASVVDGETVDLPAGTKDVEVVVETTDPESTYEITGGADLVLGENILEVVVTAPDGEATETTTVILNVLPSSDATFSGITVNGQTWVDDQRIEVEAGAVNVVVAKNNQFATVRVIGNVTNATGISELQVEVTAQDGETVETATILLWASRDVSVVPNATVNDGFLRVGTFIKLPRAQFPKAAKLTYTWLRDGEEIDGATSAKYLVSVDDFGKDVRAVIDVATAGSVYNIISKPIAIAEGLMTKAPTPSIKGKATVGSTLTAFTKEWMDGTELSYQWYRDGEPIFGSETETYELTGEDGEAVISVGITGTLEGYESVEKFSKGVTVALGLLKPSSKPSISGPFVTGGTVEVNVGEWDQEVDISIVWIRDGEVFYEGPGDDNIYEFTLDDFGSTIGMRVVVTAAGYKTYTHVVKARQIKAGTIATPGTPTVTGDPILGGSLSVDPGEYPDGAEFIYIWKRNDRIIQGATESAYIPTVRDFNASISVRVVAIIPGYKTTRTDSEGITIIPAQ
jgi:hypothetical protein